MDEVGSMPTSSIKIERACHYRLRTYWNYVGRHGADKSSTYYTRGLSGGQFTAHKAYSEMLSLVIFGEVSGYYPNPKTTQTIFSTSLPDSRNSDSGSNF